MNAINPITAGARTLADGQKVTEPGIYDLPISRYHSQCCDGPSLSSTGIRRILQSPAHFWKHSELNPNRVEEDDKEAFILGRAAHHLILGEREFSRHFVIRPDTAPDGRAWNGNNNSCREWLADRVGEGLTVLTPAQVERIRGMAGLLPWQVGMTNCGLKNTPLVMAGALSGEIERSLFWKVGSVWLKARPDAIPGDSDDFSDLKTISPRGSEGLTDRDLERAIRESRYFVQGAMVGMGARAVLQRQMAGFHLIFVDTGDVHAVSPVTIDDDDLIRGERSVFVAIKIFERCMETGVWPGPTARQADARKMPVQAWGREAIDRHLDTLEAEF
jgi:hypothetical protein